jgi:hypothetical protein
MELLLKKYYVEKYYRTFDVCIDIQKLNKCNYNLNTNTSTNLEDTLVSISIVDETCFHHADKIEIARHNIFNYGIIKYTKSSDYTYFDTKQFDYIDSEPINNEEKLVNYLIEELMDYNLY